MVNESVLDEKYKNLEFDFVITLCKDHKFINSSLLKFELKKEFELDLIPQSFSAIFSKLRRIGYIKPYSSHLYESLIFEKKQV